MTRTRAPGEGSLFPDNRGRWIGMAEAGTHPKSGKRRRVKITGADGESKASVARRLRERIAELEKSSGGPSTVLELVRAWRNGEAPNRNSPTTLDSIDAIIARHIEPVWGGVRLSAVSVDDVEAFLEARSDLSRSHLSKVKRVLSQSFAWGVRRRYVDWNPAEIASLPAKLRAPRQRRALKPDEVRTLFNAAANERNGAVVIIMGTLGLRPQEAFALEWHQIDLGLGTLAVSQTLTYPRAGPRLKLTRKQEAPDAPTLVLDIPAITTEALQAHRVAWDEEQLLMAGQWPGEWSQLVFRSSVGTPLHPSNFRRWFYQLVDEAGLERKGLTPRSLRTTAASISSDAGIPLERIADMLGHKDTRTLQLHYRKPVRPTVDTAVEVWGQVATEVANHPGKRNSENLSQHRQKRAGGP